ncbi:hypothetical protein Q0Z83_043490 [Actinoplanes sichuanensis]|nr:hypothetical protein Q0Z83_043490 [Actinoplanes sichuanensis]
MVAAGVFLAVRVARRRPVVEPAVPEPAQKAVVAVPRARRRWSLVIAGPLAAIVVLSLVLAVNRPSTSGPNPGDRLPREPNPVTERLDPDVLAALRRARAASPTSSPSPSPNPSPRSSSFNMFGPIREGYVAVPDADDRCTTPRGGMPSYRAPSPASVLALDAAAVTPCKTLVLGTTAIIGGATNSLREVTALASEDPAGDRTTLRLHVRNLSSSNFQLPFSWVLGAAQDTGWIFPTESWASAEWVLPDEEADQYVVFDVPPGARLARLRLTSTVQTVDWVIG